MQADAADDAPHTMTDIPPPPILKTWRRLYSAVLAALVVEIALFYLFTRWFA